MAISLTDLRKERKLLIEEKKKIDEKIAANDAMILAYSNSGKDRDDYNEEFDFKAIAKEVYAQNAEKPMKMVDFIRAVNRSHPQIPEGRVRARIEWAKIKGELKKVGYGLYSLSEPS